MSRASKASAPGAANALAAPDPFEDAEPALDCVQLVWFDPGVTTGVCVVQLDARWVLATAFAPSPHGLKLAIGHVEHLQFGRHGRDASVVGKQVHDALGGFGGRFSETTRYELANVAACQDVLNEWPLAAWGYESFEVRMINTSPDFLAPARIAAALTVYEMFDAVDLPIYGRAPFVQTPALAKTTMPDERLKAAGLYRPGYRHANDAARHAATFLRRVRGDVALAQQAWPHLFVSPCDAEGAA